MHTSKIYIVKRGDSISSIAQRFGHSSWEDIYYAGVNDSLRNRRPNANYIVPGDLLYIPPSPRDTLNERIVHLNRLKDDIKRTRDELLENWEKEYKKTKRVNDTVDIVGEVALIAVSLGSIVHSGFKSMKLPAEELAKANKSLAWSVGKFAYEKPLEAVAKASSVINGQESNSMLVVKVIIQSWFDMTTPSYWAQRISGIDIDQVNRQTIQTIETQYRNSTQKINRLLDKAHKDLDLARRG